MSQDRTGDTEMANIRLEVFDSHSIPLVLEHFRMFRSFCAHDLRSQIGAAVGLLQLLSDQSGDEGDKMQTMALASAKEALSDLDKVLGAFSIELEVVWVLADQEVIDLSGSGAPNALIVHFNQEDELRERLKFYKPACLIIDERKCQSDLSELIKMIGPQIVSILSITDEKISTDGKNDRSGFPFSMVENLPAPIDWTLVSRRVGEILKDRQQSLRARIRSAGK